MSPHATIRSLLAALALALVSTPSLFLPAGAQTCLDYDSRLHWVGAQPSAGKARGVVASGDLFAMLEGADGLELFHLPVDGPPDLLATIAANDSILSAVLAPPNLFVADGASIIAYDITTPSAPSPLDTLTLGADRILSLERQSAQLAACCGDSGLVLVYVADPSSMAVNARVLFASPGALDAAVWYDSVIVAGGDKVYTVDCTLYGAPVVAGQVSVPGRATHITTNGSIACSAGAGQGVAVVDLADFSNPTAIVQSTLPPSRELLLSGPFLFASRTSLYVYSVATLQTTGALYGATVLPSRSLAGADASGQGLALAQGLLLVANGASGGQAFRPADAVPVVTYQPYSWGTTTTDFALCGSLAVVSRTGGATTGILSLADPQHPILVPATLPSSVAVAGRNTLAYVLAANGTLTIHDLFLASSPALLSTRSLGVTPLSCTLSGNWLFVSAGASGLVPVDVSDPAAPVVATAIPTSISARETCVTGGIAYIVDGAGGLQTIQVLDPTHPLALGATTTPGDALGVTAFNGRAYVADGAAGITEVDVHAPANPSVVGGLDVPESATGIASAAGILYVVDSGTGLLLADARDPDDFNINGQVFLVTPPIARVRTAGDYVYTLSTSGSFRLAPRSCNTITPVFLASFTAEMAGGGAVLRWETAAPGGDFRLTARTGSTTRAVPWTRVDGTRYEARDAAALRQAGGAVEYVLQLRDGDETWLALGSRRLEIPAARTALLAPHPNPFNPRVTVAFTLERAQHARLAAFDARGRLVAHLADGEFPAGLTEIAWDGRDDRGRALASNTYFLRLETEGARETQRATLVR